MANAAQDAYLSQQRGGGGDDTAEPSTVVVPGGGQHTQFLDLTNGEGGERPKTITIASPPASTASFDMTADDGVGGGVSADDEERRTVAAAAAAAMTGTRRRNVAIDPSTPGKVVESGQEHTGRWTKEEHEAFLSALQMYGKEWKKVAAKVKTRTVVQTRTHAQKYFQKLAKTMEQTGKEDITHVDMGISSESKTRGGGGGASASSGGPHKKKRTPRQDGAPAAGTALETPLTIAASAAGATAASSSGSGKTGRRSSSATLSAAQVISNLSAGSAFGGGGGGGSNSAARHGFSTTAATTTTTTTTTTTETEPFSGGATATAGASAVPFTSTSSYRGWLSNSGASGHGMKIVAPDPASVRGRFPEPSPAATGKRKLAEIAAARMLAGVAGVSVGAGTADGTSKKQNCGVGVGVCTGRGSGGDARFDDDDGPPTPPTLYPGSELSAAGVGCGGGAGAISLEDAPPPPLFGMGAQESAAAGNGCGSDSGSKKVGLGLSLQILNPESLGVTYEEQQRRKRCAGAGDTSPVTPWDGQLEALVFSQKSEEGKDDDSTDAEAVAAAGALQHTNSRNICAGAAAAKGRGASAFSDSRPLLPVCGPAAAYNRTELHRAVCEMDAAKLQEQLDVVANQSDAVLQKRDDAGYCPLHTACAARLQLDAEEGRRQQQQQQTGEDETMAVGSGSGSSGGIDDTGRQMVTALLAAGADVSRRDSSGNTCLHWAARAGDRAVAELLLLKNSPLDAKNGDGEAPLHWSMRAGRRGMEVTALLLENGARPGLLNASFRRPIDVAADGFPDEPGSVVSLRRQQQQQQVHRGGGTAIMNSNTRIGKEYKKALKATAADRRDGRANLLIRSAHSRTLVLHHQECLGHHPKSTADWEAPDRVTSILRRVVPSADAAGVTETSGVFPHEVTVSQEFDRAKLDLLRRVHSTEYLSFVNELSKDLEKQLKESASATGGPSSGAGAAVTDESSSEQGVGGSGGNPAATAPPSSSSSAAATAMTATATPPPVVPFTPMVQRSMIKVAEPQVKLGIHSDTAFSAGSLSAARRAAGAVQHAVDCVLVGRNRNAFCVVRPPGHHAGINGLLEGGESCGFCIFNSVAAGALYAISDDRLLCDRCAIVDIDIHHGNGTEEIVRRCHDPSKLFFFSIHLYDNDPARQRKRGPNQFAYKFYPGTGAQDDLPLNIINVPISPLWKEQSPGALSTSNGPVVTKTHNTRQKTRSSAAAAAAQQQQQQEQTAAEETSSEKGTPRGGGGSRAPSDVASEAGSTTASTAAGSLSPHRVGGAANGGSSSAGRMAYRQAIQNRLLPALRAFNPDLILISAGFDACKGDVGNARHERGGKQRPGIDLEPEDYAWTTRKILEIADICCQGRVVSVLEGGYGRTPPAAAAAAAAYSAVGSSNSGDRRQAKGDDNDQQQQQQPATLDRTLFAECAVRHLQAMIDPYNIENRFTQ